MENIFEIIKAFQDKEFKSSITMPSVPNTSKIEQEETNRIKEIINELDLIYDKLSQNGMSDKKLKCKYYLDCFLVPVIVAIAIILTVIFQRNICIGDGKCDICCCKIVTYVLSIVIITVFAFFCCQWKKRIEKKYEKFSDLELKAKSDNLKKQSDVFEFKISIYRHLMHQLEFREQVDKLLLDEYARDKEHLRKIDLKEQERIAALPDKIIELGKIKNIVTLKDPRDNGKTIVIERSILSKECCEELKEILKSYTLSNDDCCKKMLKCLFGDPIDCEKVKKTLRCLICSNDNDKSNSELAEKIDRLIALIQSSGAAGMQQVVNIGGENK